MTGKELRRNILHAIQRYEDSGTNRYMGGSELAEILGEDLRTVERQLKILANEGLVDDRASSHDGMAVRLRPAGYKALEVEDHEAPPGPHISMQTEAPKTSRGAKLIIGVLTLALPMFFPEVRKFVLGLPTQEYAKDSPTNIHPEGGRGAGEQALNGPRSLSPADSTRLPIIRSESELERASNDSTGPVFVQFCKPDSPCDSFRPAIERAAQRHSGKVRFYRYELDEAATAKARAQGSGEPPFWGIYVAGKLATRTNRIEDENELERMVVLMLDDWNDRFGAR